MADQDPLYLFELDGNNGHDELYMARPFFVFMLLKYVEFMNDLILLASMPLCP